MTLTKLEEQIVDTFVMIREKETLKRKLNEAKREYEALMQKKQEVIRLLEKKQVDIRELNSTSIVTLWFSLLGSKNEGLSKEQLEQSRAEHNFKMSEIAIKQSKLDMIRLEERLDQIKTSEQKLDHLVDQKETLLTEENDAKNHKIERLNQQIVELVTRDHVLKEAEIAGSNLKQSIKKVIDLMNKAKSFGALNLFGGGLIATLSKQSYIDKAEQHIKQLQYEASRFLREYTTVDHIIQVDPGDFNARSIVDYLFDGIFLDLTLKFRFNEALTSIQNHYERVEEITGKLRAKRIENMKELKILQNEKVGLITLNTE